MENIDLKQIILELQKVTDDQLHDELKKFKLGISGNKFHNVFSAYGLSKFISGASTAVLKANTKIPDNEMNGIRWSGVFILRGYTAMVYMRSNHLESGLDNVPDNSPIAPFKKFYRAGSIKNNEDTIAQHIRNSFSHGNFEFLDGLETVKFTDRNWQATVKTSLFIDGLCEQVFRFYCAAFQVNEDL